MTDLYGCKPTQNHEIFLITKFDTDLVPQKHYLVGSKTCQCEGWQRRGQCKHAMIRTLFMMNGHTCDGHFLDFETRTWRHYPRLAEDGVIGEGREYKERYDGLVIGDNGYCERSDTRTVAPAITKDKITTFKECPKDFETGTGTASPVGAEGLSLSSPAPAPEVEPQSAPVIPSGAPIPRSDGGIKRRKGL